MDLFFLVGGIFTARMPQAIKRAKHTIIEADKDNFLVGMMSFAG